MSNPILIMKHGGHGETPVPADALLQPGDTLQITDENTNTVYDAKCIAVVPAGIHKEIAIADQTGEPRPLMLTKKTYRETSYIIDLPDSRVTVLQSKMLRGLDKAKARAEATP